MNLFYELLQISIGTRSSFSVSPTKDEWLEIFKEADRQCIIGVLFSGVEIVVRQCGGLANMSMDPDLFATWYSYIQKIEEKNKDLNKKSAWIQQWLKKEGLSSCILKGQGNAILYPIPSRRASGDIDVWVWFDEIEKSATRPKYRGSENRLQFIKWVQKKMNGKYAEVGIHHIHLEPLGDTAVEGHYWPTYLFSFPNMKHFEHWCEDEHQVQMNNWKELPDGTGQISVPTVEFNMIFQLVHIMRHFFHDGMGLRQLVDYYWLLSSGKIDIVKVKEMLDKLNLNNVMNGLMWIMKEVFGMSEDKLPFPVDRRVGELMLKEIERGGNFGHDDRDIAKWRYDSKIQIFLWRTWRNIKFMRICPSEVLWSPFFRIWQFFWIHRMEGMAKVYNKERG